MGKAKISPFFIIAANLSSPESVNFAPVLLAWPSYVVVNCQTRVYRFGSR